MGREIEKINQIAIVSGKGGTGKTTIAAALSSLFDKKVIADCDVDAANLHLILNPEVKIARDFFGGELAMIDPDTCTNCMKCVEVCRYNAINDSLGNRPPVVIDEFCEGCAACFYVCPVGAIKMKKHKSGELYISETKNGPMVHARLGIAEDNSGKLVSDVRKAANKLASERNLDTILIDGPPGIGCPVIATVTGIDLAIVVTEPSVSGMSDLKRILELTSHFNLPTRVIINKSDINPDITKAIKDEAKKRDADVVGELIYHEGVIDTIREGKNIIESGPEEIRDEIISIRDKLQGFSIKRE